MYGGERALQQLFESTGILFLAFSEVKFAAFDC